MIFETVTLAMKAENVLKRRGIMCRVVKADGYGSCRYGVVLSCNHMSSAINTVSSYSIPIYATGNMSKGAF